MHLLPPGLGEGFTVLTSQVQSMNHRLVGWAQALPPTAAAFVAALSLVAVVIGARRPMVRLVAAVVGLLLGFAYLARFAPWLTFLHLPVRDLTWAVGGTFAVLGALLPEGITFLVGGLFCGVLVSSLLASDLRIYAFVPGFLVGGAFGVLAFPVVAAVVASFGGGLVCAATLAALLPRASLGGYLLTHPLTTSGLGLAIGLAGFLGQLRGVERKEAAAAKAKKLQA